MTTREPKAEVKLSRAKSWNRNLRRFYTSSQEIIKVDYRVKEDVYADGGRRSSGQGLFSAGIEHLALYHDNPEITAEENLKCDVCIRICKPAGPNGDIGVKTIGGGRFVAFTYIGEYCKIEAAYDKIYGGYWQKEVSGRGSYCFEKSGAIPAARFRKS